MAKQTADENRLCYIVLEKPVIKCHKSVSQLGSKELDLEGNKRGGHNYTMEIVYFHYSAALGPRQQLHPHRNDPLAPSTRLREPPCESHTITQILDLDLLINSVYAYEVV